MDRFETINKSGIMLAKRDSESVEGEKLADKMEGRLVCKGEACDVNWKPAPANGDKNEDKE